MKDMSFDRVIISTNEHPSYIQFWPLVAQSYKKYFPDKKLTLAFLTTEKEDSTKVEKMRRFGDVVLFHPISGIPLENQAKLVRYILASRYTDEVCMINDIDTCPLRGDYYIDIATGRKKGHLLAHGAEVYNGTPHEGKFPAGLMSAEGYVFKEIYNPNDKSLDELFNSDVYKLSNVFDNKESITTIPSCWNEVSGFSDESLNRALISQWPGSPDRIYHVPRGFISRRDWIDRSRWNIDMNRLKAAGPAGYYEVNFLRPFSSNYERMKPIIEHLYGFLPPYEEVIIS